MKADNDDSIGAKYVFNQAGGKVGEAAIYAAAFEVAECDQISQVPVVMSI